VGFWKWLGQSVKKAVLLKSSVVFIISYTLLVIWIVVVNDLKRALLGILVWVGFWGLYNAYEYYKCYVEKEASE